MNSAKKTRKQQGWLRRQRNKRCVRPKKLHRKKLKNRENRYCVLGRQSLRFLFLAEPLQPLSFSGAFLFAFRQQGLRRVSYSMSLLPWHCRLILHLGSSAG